jgi:hypothetical protein
MELYVMYISAAFKTLEGEDQALGAGFEEARVQIRELRGESESSRTKEQVNLVIGFNQRIPYPGATGSLLMMFLKLS